jgi:hypothetical protein
MADRSERPRRREGAEGGPSPQVTQGQQKVETIQFLNKVGLVARSFSHRVHFNRLDLNSKFLQILNLSGGLILPVGEKCQLHSVLKVFDEPA